MGGRSRVEICWDCHDQQSCKICASCKSFPGKQRKFFAQLAYNYNIYTHQVWFCTKTVKFLHKQLNSNKKFTYLTDDNAFTLFLFQ